MAFKVLNALEEQAQSEWEACLPQEVDLQTQALVAALRPAAAAHGPKGALRSGGATRGRTPPGECFKCGSEGHWAKQCPQPRAPTKPCPACGQNGHWKSDCPGKVVGLLRLSVGGPPFQARTHPLAMLELAED